MFYDRFEMTTRQYESERAHALRQHQLITAVQSTRQAQQAPSPLRRWWAGFCRWLTNLSARRVPSAPSTEDPSTS